MNVVKNIFAALSSTLSVVEMMYLAPAVWKASVRL